MWCPTLAYYPRTLLGFSLLLPLHVGLQPTFHSSFSNTILHWTYPFSSRGRIFSETWLFQNALIQPSHLTVGITGFWARNHLPSELWRHPPPIFLRALVINSNSSNSYWKWMDRKVLPPQLGSRWLSLHSVWHGNTAISLEDSKIHKCFLWGCPILTEKRCSWSIKHVISCYCSGSWTVVEGAGDLSLKLYSGPSFSEKHFSSSPTV